MIEGRAAWVSFPVRALSDSAWCSISKERAIQAGCTCSSCVKEVANCCWLTLGSRKSLRWEGLERETVLCVALIGIRVEFRVALLTFVSH